MDRGAEREGVLQEEEVADVGEVGLRGAEHALELGEVDECNGFEQLSDNLRIPRSCGPARTAGVGSGGRKVLEVGAVRSASGSFGFAQDDRVWAGRTAL